MGMAKRDHLSALLQLPEVQERWDNLHGRPSNENDVDHIYHKFLPLQRSVPTVARQGDHTLPSISKERS